MIRWGNLEYLGLLVLVWPVLIIFYRITWAARMAALERFGNRELVARLTASVDRGRQKFKLALVLLAVTLLMLSLARPQWGATEQRIKRTGVDIIVALDTSLSMLAEDVKPNRLERAKYEIRRLLDRLEGDRIGLVMFEGEAFVQCPLTLDYGAALLFLKETSPGMVPLPGTNLAAPIEVAMRAFVQEEQKYKVLILITDGEQTVGGDPVEAARQAAREGVRIYTIGVGDELGAPLQYHDEGNQLVTKQDRDGRPVLSRLDSVTLQKIALETSGAYKPAAEGGLELDEIYREIRAAEEKELQSTLRVRYTERFQLPLLVAVVLLIVEQLYSDRRRWSAAGPPPEEPA